MKKADWDIAKRLNYFIAQLDGFVFPENPIKNIFCVTARSRSDIGHICYGPKRDNLNQPEHYCIFSYRIDKTVNEEKFLSAWPLRR